MYSNDIEAYQLREANIKNYKYYVNHNIDQRDGILEIDRAEKEVFQ